LGRLKKDRDIHQITETLMTRIVYKAVIPDLIRLNVNFKVTQNNAYVLTSNRQDPKGGDGDIIGKAICVYTGILRMCVFYDIYVVDCATFM